MAHGLHFLSCVALSKMILIFQPFRSTQSLLFVILTLRFYMPSETSGMRVNLMALMLNGRCWATRFASERGRSCMALEPCLKDETWNPFEL